MIRLTVTVSDITQVLAAGYTVVRVYTDTTESGTFVTLDGTITLVAGNTGYEYVDTSGTSSKWYKLAYYGAVPGEGSKTDARKGETFASYGTVTEFKRRLMGSQNTDDIDDHTLGLMLDAISRSIDAETERRFFTTTSDETRYYTAAYGDILWPDDILSVTTLKTDEDGDRTYETTWATTDYDLMPFNATADYKPYTQIMTTPQGDYTFPTVAKGVEIAGTFGYCTEANRSLWAPQVAEVCYLAAEKWYGRKDAIFGIVGTPGLGELRRIAYSLLKSDTDIQDLLRGLKRGFAGMEIE